MSTGTTRTEGVVVVGGGQAGFSVASTLRARGYTGPVTVFAAEPHLPYQRPPLSKKAHTEPDELRVSLVPESFYAERHIELRLGDGVIALDLAARTVRTRAGGHVPYAHLVLATGARNRPCPSPAPTWPASTPARSTTPWLSAGLWRRPVTWSSSAAASSGSNSPRSPEPAAPRVTVVELADRLLSRAVSPQLQEHLRQRHEESGVRVLTGTAVHAVEGTDRVRQVVTSAGILPADLVVYGIGAVPRDELARDAGLAVDDGVLVDEQLRSVTDRGSPP
ncbi:FAD-dependent oxidoreductase [Streptomyces mirabilis]|nr:FAD-dependent oxidoreductase [Streptomyces mirabilis]